MISKCIKKSLDKLKAR